MGASMGLDSATAEAEALGWIIRVQHPDFADWDALSAWLAADPRHAEIFQQLTLLDCR
jgi:transmembrane sensor